MRNSEIRDIPFFGEIHAKELSVAELDQLLYPVQSSTPVLDRLLSRHGISAGALNKSLGLELSDQDDHPPSSLRPLVELFQRVNEDFFLALEAERETVAALAGMEREVEGRMEGR